MTTIKPIALRPLSDAMPYAIMRTGPLYWAGAGWLPNRKDAKPFATRADAEREAQAIPAGDY